MATLMVALAMGYQDANLILRQEKHSYHPPHGIATFCLTFRFGPSPGFRAVQIRCRSKQMKGTRDGRTTQDSRVHHSDHVSSLVCFGPGKMMFKGSISGAT